MVSDNQIAVSVYCLTYNHEKYIRKTLDGFVMQKTSFPFEVIVHDDASTDNTAAIVKEYEEKYPNIIKGIYQKENQKSQGVNIYLKHILPIIRGKYVATCEGDDFWINENKLQIQFDAMEEHPECSLCVCKVLTCNEDESPNIKTFPNSRFGLIGEGGIKLSENKVLELLWEDGEYPFQTSSYFFRQSSLLPPDHELKKLLVRDRGRLRELFLSGDFYYIYEPMSTYRLFSIGSWSSGLVNAGNPGMEKSLVENIQMELGFDKYTEGRYQKSILICVVEMIYRIATFHAEYAVTLYNELLKSYDEKVIMESLSNCLIEKKRKELNKKFLRLKRNPYGIEKEFIRSNKREEFIKKFKAKIKQTKVGRIIYHEIKKHKHS